MAHRGFFFLFLCPCFDIFSRATWSVQSIPAGDNKGLSLLTASMRCGSIRNYQLLAGGQVSLARPAASEIFMHACLLPSRARLAQLSRRISHFSISDGGKAPFRSSQHEGDLRANVTQRDRDGEPS